MSPSEVLKAALYVVAVAIGLLAKTVYDSRKSSRVDATALEVERSRGDSAEAVARTASDTALVQKFGEWVFALEEQKEHLAASVFAHQREIIRLESEVAMWKRKYELVLLEDLEESGHRERREAELEDALREARRLTAPLDGDVDDDNEE